MGDDAIRRRGNAQFRLHRLEDRDDLTTRDAVAGHLPSVLAQAGFAQVAETRQFVAIFHILSLYSAIKVAP